MLGRNAGSRQGWGSSVVLAAAGGLEESQLRPLSFRVALVRTFAHRELGGAITASLLVRRFLVGFGAFSLLVTAIVELLVSGLFLHASVSHSRGNLAILGPVKAAS